jgi:glycosyltransferase involved in cell wall biosynthesis
MSSLTDRPLESTEPLAPPRVSIILPTYNRGPFLEQAFHSIAAQTFRDWELIVVDDGSEDDTRDVVKDCAASLGRVRYIHQANQGAYGARNTGLDHARGEFVAFFDSDDIWLPHHLARCVEGLDANPDVDWVYGACRVVDHATGRVITPSTFYVDGEPRAFMRLAHRQSGRLRILDDPNATSCIIRNGHYCGLQNSVMRRRVMAHRRFAARLGHECEDRLVVVRAMVEGHTFAHIDDVHVIYHVHPANSSSPGSGGDGSKTLTMLTELVRGREQLRRELRLTRAERRALDWRIGQDLFWSIGYSLLWQRGRGREALDSYRRALTRWPWDLKMWKTYIWSLLRVRVAGKARPEEVA